MGIADLKEDFTLWGAASIRFDRQRLQRASARAESARVERREILKFIPPKLENQLAKIEPEYAMARGRSCNSIVNAVFISKSGGDGYQFVVSQQHYRKQKD